MKDRKVNHIVNSILEGRSVREALMQATIKDPVTGKYVDVDFENPWDKSSDNSYKVSDIFDYATLLSIEEYEKYKSNIPKLDDWWWLRSPAPLSNEAAIAYTDDTTTDYNDFVQSLRIYLRPALHIKSPGVLSVGDSFNISDYSFTVISKDYALCDTFIRRMAFRSTPELDDKFNRFYDKMISREAFYAYCDSIHANDYEYSDAKKVVDNWFNKNKNSEII